MDEILATIENMRNIVARRTALLDQHQAELDGVKDLLSEDRVKLVQIKIDQQRLNTEEMRLTILENEIRFGLKE